MIIFNGKALSITHFSNSECRIRELSSYIKDKNIVEFIFETDKEGYKVNEDLMNLLFVSSELMQHYKNVISSILVFWCMPYQRMDRKCIGDIFTLDPICEYINWLNFDEVIVVDPHSEVTLKLIKNSRAIYPLIDWLPKIKEQIDFSEADDYIVFPDKGAAKRYINYNLGTNICFCEKERNKITNFIEDSKIINGDVKKGCKCIIVDDLCSKGDTILKCCELLKELGVDEIYVVVTHCEPNILSNPVFLNNYSLIKKIFTSKSNMSKSHYKIEYLDINIL